MLKKSLIENCARKTIQKYIFESLSDSERMKIYGKIMDDGYLVHCTDADFDNFDCQYIKGSFRGREGYGFYFSNLPYKPIEYGSKEKVIKKSDFNFISLYTKIDNSNFRDLINGQYLMTEKYKLENELDYTRNNSEYNYISNRIDNINNIIVKYGELFSIIENTIIHYSPKNLGELFYSIPSNRTQDLSKLLLYFGYDGYSDDDGIFVVFNFEKLNQNLIDIKSLI